MDGKFYLDGAFVEREEKLSVVNPYDQKEIVTVSLATEDDVEKAILSAQRAFENSKKLRTYQRVEALEYIAQQLAEKKQYLAELLAKEGGKPITQASDEIDRGVSTFKLAAQHIASESDELMPLDVTAKAGNRFALIKRFPAGIVYGISPFNFPLNLVAHKVAPALASGCPIILKPASATPLTALELAKIFDQTQLPKGLFQVLPMNRTIGNLLVADERIAVLSFTGSPAVGWPMKQQAGKKKVVLELGGDAALYIHKDADIEKVAFAAARGAFANAGQICISIQRMMIHTQIYDTFMKAFLEEVKKLPIGDTLKNETIVGPLIDLKNKERILSWIDEAKQAGVTILQGGSAISDTLVAPTVFADSPAGLKIVDEEAFGPVVHVYKVAHSQEAFDKINASKFGLQCGIFTNDAQVQFDAFEQIDCAGIIINDIPTFRVDNMPYGGVKDSGFGREGIKYAIEDMTERKLLVINRNERYQE